MRTNVIRLSQPIPVIRSHAQTIVPPKDSFGKSPRRKNQTQRVDPNYRSSTQRMFPSKNSWSQLYQAVHDLSTKCFVGITNSELLAQYLRADSQLGDFYRLTKMLFNNTRPGNLQVNPTSALGKIGLNFIQQWDGFLTEFNNVNGRGVAPLLSLISHRLISLSTYFRSISKFFLNPQPTVPIGVLHRAHASSLAIARSARRLHSNPQNYPIGIGQLDYSIYDFFLRIVPKSMMLSNNLQNCKKDVNLMVTELHQMVNGVSIFETLTENVKILMEEANTHFNELFADLNLPYKIEASYETDDVQIDNEEEEEEEANEELINQRKQDEETSAHLEKIRSHIAQIENALTQGENYLKKKT